MEVMSGQQFPNLSLKSVFSIYHSGNISKSSNSPCFYPDGQCSIKKSPGLPELFFMDVKGVYLIGPQWAGEVSPSG